MNLNEQIIRPLLSNVSVIGLFFIPMITMRLFAEEKRSGTIELLMTSPIRDLRNHPRESGWRRWRSMHACCCSPALNFAVSFQIRQPGLEAAGRSAYLGLLLQAGALLAIGTFISTLTKNQIIAGAATFGVCLLLWVLDWVSGYETATWAKVLSYLSVITHFRIFRRRACLIRKTLVLLSHRDFPGTVLHRALHGIAALEVIDEHVNGSRQDRPNTRPMPRSTSWCDCRSRQSPMFSPIATTNRSTPLRTSATASPTRRPRSSRV